jgi:hypothetical protein
MQGIKQEKEDINSDVLRNLSDDSIIENEKMSEYR